MVQPDAGYKVPLEGPLGALLETAFESEMRWQGLPLCLCLALDHAVDIVSWL